MNGIRRIKREARMKMWGIVQGFKTLLILLMLTKPILGYEPEPEVELELEALTCPGKCVCQLEAFKELPIARWVNHMAGRNVDDGTPTKLATCLIQSQNEWHELRHYLPMDLQALILLYTGNVENQLAVNTSSLRQLKQLRTLEIRGTGATLIIDDPLKFLQHANFEQIRLQASDRLQRPKFSKLPSDDYEYKPPSELLPSSEYSTKYPLQFEDAASDIVTYEQHMQRLKQTRMPSFFGWKRLEVLRIVGCKLDKLHWQMFDGLNQLRDLNLERNSIEELPPFAFSGALNLKSLSLAHNGLSRLHYLGLAGLLQLETLNLADNQLERLSELSFPPLPKLQKADLRSNPVKYILPGTFWVMNDTRELQMGSDQAALDLRTWFIYGQFDSLNELRTLVLGNVSTETLEQGVFKGLYNLEFLKLRGKIHSIQFDVFAGMEQLRELDISQCGVSELSMDAFMGVKRLKFLNLSHNNLTNMPHGLLDDQQRLEEVQLQGNQLKTLPESFLRLPLVRVIRLDQNPWQCSCQMRYWKPYLTNVVRGLSVKRCVKDINGDPISCRFEAPYETDKSLVPRCANYNGRSVYYVLRKQLHCGDIQILQPHKRGLPLPHWRKIELQDQDQQSKKARPRKVAQKPKKQRNTLQFVLQRQKEQPHPEPLVLEMSNEI
ncbi:leucine-rich repeats and immunoglobulin-like domains protein 3 [Drosophila guanche]|uniref:Blast:Insulin-like growth factor-binding protein complex acid labile subunit n=3 Tax=Drosophila guanche TaxID=7266 RepID=A0A3B0JTY6_DROGU|nr:leucine-rich repeats and immunoglobulin-like domains protein 3 [Drosophila guanche]SPP85565.1 blast:Insulin-like growth factor-binding protein complex acid labile subunit [Drosophila guanche]